MVQLAEPLVDAAAQAAQNDDVEGPGMGVGVGVDVVDGFAKVGGFLFRVVDDLGWLGRMVVVVGRRVGEVGPGFGGEGV